MTLGPAGVGAPRNLFSVGSSTPTPDGVDTDLASLWLVDSRYLVLFGADFASDAASVTLTLSLSGATAPVTAPPWVTTGTSGQGSGAWVYDATGGATPLVLTANMAGDDGDAQGWLFAIPMGPTP